MPNYFQISSVVCNKRIFKVFLLVAMETRMLHGIEIVEQL